jgi:hypothetical protein
MIAARATILEEDRVDAASGEISEEVTVLEASEGSGPRLECVQCKQATRRIYPIFSKGPMPSMTHGTLGACSTYRTWNRGVTVCVPSID